MPRGPILNDISRNFTTRDSLGIEGVAATIQASVCRIVTGSIMNSLTDVMSARRALGT